MTTKKRVAKSKGVTYEQLRRKLDRDNAYLSPEDGQALVEAVQEMRESERRRARTKSRRATGS